MQYPDENFSELPNDSSLAKIENMSKIEESSRKELKRKIEEDIRRNIQGEAFKIAATEELRQRGRFI